MPKQNPNVHITLKARQRAFVRKRVVEGGFASVDDYVSELIRLDQEQTGLKIPTVRKAKPRFVVDSAAELDVKLAEAIHSGRFEEATPEWWASVRAEAAKRARMREAARKRRRRRA